MKSETITRVVAIYGAVLATLTFVWNVVRELRDAGRLRTTLLVGRIFSDPPEVAPRLGLDKVRVYATITNVGRRPITPAKWGGFKDGWLGFKRQGFIICPRNLPRELRPGEYVEEGIDELADLLPMKVLYVWDSTGRRWRVTRRELRRAKRDCRKALRKPAEAAT